MSVLELFVSGGGFMYPLLGLSILAIAMIIERGISTILFHRKTRGFILFLRTKGVEGSMPIDGVDRTIFSNSQADRILEQGIQLQFDRFQAVLSVLTVIGSAAPLLGFIGTVAGMIEAFQTIANSTNISVGLVAGGISKALITTGFGLIVAVVCILGEHLFHFYLTARAHRVEEEVTLSLVGDK